MKRIFIHKANDTAVFYYRASAPVQHCQPSLPDIELTCSKFWDSDDDYDAFVFHGILNPMFLNIARQLAMNGKKIIMSFDDDVFNVPQWNPASVHIKESQLDIVRESLSFAHMVLVSTEALSSVMPCDKNKIRVCPNLIDVDLYGDYEKIENDPVRILWAGSIHHHKDLELIEDAALKLLESHNVEFIFFGDLPAKLTTWKPIFGTYFSTKEADPRWEDKLHYVHPCDLESYISTLQSIRADIAIAPLVNCKFNESKSNIKWMEYSMTNSAVLASAEVNQVSPYVNHGCAKLLSNKYWYDGLTTLLENKKTMADMIKNSRENIINNFSWQSTTKQVWINFFKECAND